VTHRSVLVAAILLSGATRAVAAGPTCSSMAGVWHNQLGSTLTIASVDSTSGRVEGSYVSPSGTQGQARPLLGWTNSQAPKKRCPSDAKEQDNIKAISFAVHWGPYGSITSWTGYCRDEKGIPTITTVWHLVRSNSDYSWDHILTNSDTFTPGAAVP
jgi:hypothetical protein